MELESNAVLALITLVIPFASTVLKKVIKTDRLDKGKRKGINTLLPLVLGIVSAGLYAYTEGGSAPLEAIAIGLGSGSIAAAGRNVEKNVLGIAKAVFKLFKR